MCLLYKSFENSVGKGEIALNKQFLLFLQCFLPFWRPFFHFHQIQNCRLQTLSVWKRLKFVVWERVKQKPTAVFMRMSPPKAKTSILPSDFSLTPSIPLTSAVLLDSITIPDTPSLDVI